MTAVRDTRLLWFVVAVIAVNILALGLLAYRTEANRKENAAIAYSSCLARNVNIERLNRTWDGLRAIEEENPYVDTSPLTVQRRIDLYLAARLDPVPCVRP